VVFPARVFHVKSRVSCGLIPLLVVVYSPSFITRPPSTPGGDQDEHGAMTNERRLKIKGGEEDRHDRWAPHKLVSYNYMSMPSQHATLQINLVKDDLDHP
jgi:hypothetical protein